MGQAAAAIGQPGTERLAYIGKLLPCIWNTAIRHSGDAEIARGYQVLGLLLSFQ
jgi:hypothetical protein